MLSSAIRTCQPFSSGDREDVYGDRLRRTFEEFATIDLAGGDFKGDDMALG
jgi:hypothetical protein